MDQNFDADTGMPLRQTCNRCRYLKVRCEKDSHSSSDRCVRCEKAGAICIHNRRRRSGRPSVNSLQNGSRDALLSSTSSLSLDFCNDRLSQSDCPEMTSQGSGEPCGDLSWLNARLMGPFPPINQFMEFGEDTTHLSSFDPDVAPEHEPELSTNRIMVAQGHRLENFSTARDAMEADMRELTELSLRAYRVVRVASIPSTDELLAMTQSTLKILARIASTVRRQQNPASVTSSEDLDSPPNQHDRPRTSISLVLQAISVCEQIFNAFVHACSALRSELEPPSEPGIDSGSSGDDHRTSDAQAVMTVELINYLFEKLSRSQRQLLATAFTADESLSSSSSQGDSSPEGSSITGTVSATLACDGPTTLIPVMMHRAQGKHTQLHSYIQTIRHLTRQNDYIE